jgi:hypothetical protein
VLTMDNVRQLLDSRLEDRQPGFGEGSSAKGEKKRRKRNKVELASVGRRASSDTSSMEGGQKSPGRASANAMSFRSRRSRASLYRGGAHKDEMAASLLDSGSNTASSISHVDLHYDPIRERARVRDFYTEHGYMPAPMQTPEAMRRRLRVIRRLGLEDATGLQHDNLDRFTRLAISMFKTRMAMITIIGKEKQTYLSAIGIKQQHPELDLSFCAHTIISGGESCMVIPDATQDWRFGNNPLVKQDEEKYRFYVGAPLRVGNDAKSAVIGSLCLVDDKPREFGEHERGILYDLAQCVVSEVSGFDSRARSFVRSSA